MTTVIVSIVTMMTRACLLINQCADAEHAVTRRRCMLCLKADSWIAFLLIMLAALNRLSLAPSTKCATLDAL